MNFLLPADIEREFTDPAYWKQFFEHNSSLEWLGDYSKHSEIFKKYVRPTDSILQIGCENSTLADELYDNGFRNVLSIDTDSKVIAKAKKNSEKRPSLNYAVSSVTEIDPPNGQVDVVIDKGTLDAFLPLECSSQDVQLVDDMFEEITRCLAPLGRYIVITLAQQHIVAKLVEFFGTNDFMIRVQKNVLTEADFVMPVFVFRITKYTTKERRQFEFLNASDSRPESADSFEGLFKKIHREQQMDWFRHYISRGPVEETSVRISSAAGGEDRYELFIVDDPNVKSLCKYGVFVVPIGRESDLDFATPRGRSILRRDRELQRIIVVRLSRGQVYESLDKIEEELKPVILDFMPIAFSRQKITYQWLGATDVSKQIATGVSKISGKWSVEHVSVDESMYRRLVFLNSIGLTQSEVELKREKKDNWVVDWSKPLCDHHRHMLLALEFLCDSEEGKVIGAEAAKGQQLRLAVLGLGGGILTKFLHDDMFRSQIVGVELDAEMVAIARKHFHFPNSDHRLRVDICDAYEFLQNSAASPDKEKFEAIFVDLSGSVNEHGLYCPPPQFVTKVALTLMRDSLTPGGVLTLNLVTRDDKIAEEVKKRSRAVFLSVICVKGAEDIYEVLICSGQPPKKFKRLLKKRKGGGGDECLVMKDEMVNQQKSAEDAPKKNKKRGSKKNKKNQYQSGEAIAKNPSKLASTSSDEPATMQESLAVQEVGVHNKSESPCKKMKCQSVEMDLDDLKKTVAKMGKNLENFEKRITQLEKQVSPMQLRNIADKIVRSKNKKRLQRCGGERNIINLRKALNASVHTSYPANGAALTFDYSKFGQYKSTINKVSKDRRRQLKIKFTN